MSDRDTDDLMRRFGNLNNAEVRDYASLMKFLSETQAMLERVWTRVEKGEKRIQHLEESARRLDNANGRVSRSSGTRRKRSG